MFARNCKHDAILRRLLSTLITKTRHGLLQVTLLIPIDFSFPLVEGTHGTVTMKVCFSESVLQMPD
eukprot:532993-Pelagomonas_calceolata.AAC.1